MEAQKNLDDETSSSVVVVTPAETGSEKGSDAAMPAEAEEEKKLKYGMTVDMKNLYAKYDSNGNRSWSNNSPEDLEAAAENDQTQKYALIVRREKPKQADSTRPLVIDSLIIQSPVLKQALGIILDKYPNIVTNVSRLTLSAPFQCLVHRWDKLLELKDDPNQDPITRDHLGLLYTILKEELGDVIQLRADYYKNRVVDFSNVWTIFPPGVHVYGSLNGKPLAVKFLRGNFAKNSCGETIYQLQCWRMDWDGSVIGWANTTLRIPEFIGTVPFKELPCFPLDYHPNADAVKHMLRLRGQRWRSLAGHHYRSYEGPALYITVQGKIRSETVGSRIVVDGANWEKSNPDFAIRLAAISDSLDQGVHRSRCDDDDCDSDEEDEGSSVYSESVPDPEELPMTDDPPEKVPHLTEEQLLLTCPWVRGYALKNKRWMEFFIDDVVGVQFDDKAFDSLVLPSDQKELILAFAKSQVKYKNAFDDVISGKGKGIIMLLSGGPGIGKTLTAESVAEEMRVPLYIMSAGDLGSNANEVDENLKKILEMVADWNAVLLLDECDVFLEERSPHDIQRNRIVSIFLRCLEYYSGILFLTTNRVRNMDPAFQSRIHISLEYPPLDSESRATVWRTFLARSANLRDRKQKEAGTDGAVQHDVSEDDVAALSRLDINGRQIKNVLKAASLLACNKHERLSFNHLRTVLRVEGHSL